MPIYEYRCLDCNHEFERMQKFSDPPVETCPTCAGAVQKLISRSAFHLKGDGWYVTDYARKGGQNGTSRSKSSSASSQNEKSSGDTKASSDSTSASETSKSSNAGATASA
jgi:putative FmdB family regulatory protein